MSALRVLCNRYTSFVAHGRIKKPDVQEIYGKVKPGKIFQRCKKVIYSQKETRKLKNKDIKIKKRGK